MKRSSRRFTPYILFFLMFAFIIYGLFKVQIFEQETHKGLLRELMGKNEYLRGLRGTIYSSDGEKLAWSEKIPVIILTSYSEEDDAKLKKYLSQQQLVALKNNGKVEITWEQAFLLKNAGYIVKTVEKRRSYGFVYHIVGSVNTDLDGTSGLEYIYNDVLKGKIGVSYSIKSPGGGYQQEIIETQADKGLDLQISINFKLQKFIYETLRELSTPSVAIVSKPKTGEIISMVSTPVPEIDMNDLDIIAWEKIINDPLKPLLNRAVSNTYPPGSTFKVITALAQLLFSSPKVVNCSGVFHYRDSKGRVTGKYKDWLISGHGSVDIKKALRVSCNVYFYSAGLDVGVENIVKVAKAFGLGEKTGISLLGESEGTLPTPEWKYETFKEKWYPGDTILYSIGQGFLSVTPLQILLLYNTIARKGIMVTPKLVVNEETVEKQLSLNVPEHVWNTIIDGLEQVTTVQGYASNAGTAASSFKGFPITVAGKTGTAQVGKDIIPHAWFVGFAPSRDPMYTVLVLIENGESGGRTAAPVARKIFDFMYQNNFFENFQKKNN